VFVCTCVCCVRIANTFELRTTNASMKTVSLAAESVEDRQTWLVKLARVSTTLAVYMSMSIVIISVGQIAKLLRSSQKRVR